MDFKTILVDLAEDDARDARLDAALQLASWFDGQVIGLAATGALLDPYRSAGEETLRYDAMRADMLRGVRAASEAVLREAVTRHGSVVKAAPVIVEQETGWALASHGMTSDIILPAPPGLARDVPPLMASVAEYAMTNSGKPVLVVPAHTALLPLETAIVAWNGRREAARALADALPLLRLAERVVIHVINDSREDGGMDVVQWLATHGVTATMRRDIAASAAECLLEKVLEESAGLLVAGGYGHSRIGELVMGGTTRTLLRNTPVPLLMSH